MQGLQALQAVAHSNDQSNNASRSQICRPRECLDADSGGMGVQGFATGVAEQAQDFQAILDSNEAHEMPLPEPWNARLNSFQKLAVLRCLRPDKVLTFFQYYKARATTHVRSLE